MQIKNILFTAMASIAFFTGAYAQNVNIPDANFKAALVNNSSINNNMDGEIQVSEASVFNGAINVSQLNITDLTGIETFTVLTNLNCSGNQLTSVNVSANSALTNLNCSGNQNQLTNLNVTGCTALTSLDCSGNYYYFTNLDVSSCTALTTLNCAYNRLTSLNVSSCTTLTYLDCSNNQIAGLDVSSNSALTYLDCSKNCKPPMMLPEGNFSDYVYFLDSLDVTANIALTILKCNNNGLLSLNTTGLTALAYLDCSFNPRGFFNGMKSYVWCHSSSPLLNFSSNTALSYLNCSGNVLQNLNVSACTALTYLDCSDEQEWAPEMMICETPQLTSLDVSANTLLTNLDIAYNSLSILDVSANTLLTNLACNDNQLTSLDLKNGNNINMLTFNALGNPNLSCIEVDNTDWSNSNWYYIDATASFSENCNALGILDNNESNEPMFYPNPTTGTIYLSEPANTSLSDLSGKLLLEEKNTNQLDISALPTGMYFLHFGENNNQIVKVIKE